MIVKLPKHSGFCPGVKAAEKRIFSELREHPDTDYAVLGHMINNRKYIDYLTAHDVITIENPENIDDESTVFIRTHGIDRDLQEELSKSHNLIDLTCRNVKRVQEIIDRYSNEGAMVFITGKRIHPEVIGLKSYSRKSFILESEDELDKFIRNPVIDGSIFNPDAFSGIFITSQTTGSRKLFDSVITKISRKWPEAGINIFNSICPVTSKKEHEALVLQEETDISFVIGDPMSSNASKLFSILKEADEATWFIQDAEELKKLNLDFSGCKSALVVSSASTPDFVEKEVIAFLESI